MGQQGEGADGREARDLTVTRQRVVDPPYASEAVTELVRVAFGLVAVGLGVALRTLDPAPASPTRTVRGSGLPVTDRKPAAGRARRPLPSARDDPPPPLDGRSSDRRCERR